jgi:hypothetical protein
MPAGRLENLRGLDQVLTKIARGYSNNGYIGKNLFPEVAVDVEGGKIPLWGKESFRIFKTARAIRANSNEMEGAWLDTTPFALEEHDIVQRLDAREIKNASVPLDAKATENVMDQLLLGQEKMQADLAQSTDTYLSSNKVTLTTNYFDTDSIDWIEAIHDYKSTLNSLIAKDPNTMIIPKIVWDKLKFHPKLKGYITVSQDLFSAVASLQKLQEILEIPNILIGNAKYTNDGTNLLEIWSNNIILAYVVPPSGVDRTPYEPCFGYTLNHNGYPYVDRYETEGGKVMNIRATALYDVKIVGSESAFLINNPINPSNL